MSFIEERFNTEIRYGTVGGPEFNTDILVVDSGHEFRNSNWLDARGRWEIGDDLYNRQEIEALASFFRAVRGKAIGFRFKDWSDFKTIHTNGRLGAGTANGNPTYQMYKRYTSESGSTYDRKITKPVEDTVTVHLAGVEIAATVDYTTGVITMPQLSSSTISGITKAANGVVTTTAAHGLTTGDEIYITGVLGMTEVNNTLFTITVLTTTTFSLNVNTSGYTNYSSGGLVKKYAQSGTLTWEGEFDVPARFDTDRFDAQFQAYRDSDSESLFAVSGLSIVELRI